MDSSLNLDLSELLKMFGKYRRRLNSDDPEQEELYDALMKFDIAVLNKIRQLRDIYWNVLQKQTLTYKQKAYQILSAEEEWKVRLLVWICVTVSTEYSRSMALG